MGAVSAADAAWSLPGTRSADWLTYLLLAVSVAALLGRRRAPVPVAAICGAALTSWYLLGHRGELLALASMVALYTVAVRGGRRRTILVGAVAVVWSGALGWWAAEPASAPVTELLWPVVALSLGEAVRVRRELADAYADQAARNLAEREREARRRVQRERVSIAREVHDVLAHTMAAVNVQMGVAVAAFDRRPEAARAALGQARAASADALRELRAALALLREDAPAGPPPPVPGLDQLDALVEGARRAGPRVSLDRRLTDRPLPAGVALAVHRIVQESLTNVIRHAGAGSVAVSVRDRGGEVAVEVVDDGAGPDHRPATDRGTGGFGLAGMAERVSALGGWFESGPLPGGGFRVHAVLPVTRPGSDGSGEPA